MADHQMNPFDFVPLPKNGPLQPNEVLNDTERYEGFIDYSISTLTPVNIAGKIECEGHGNSLHYKQKSFFRYQSGGPCVIPGSSIRGMIASFIEALTGSDFGALTVGDEKNSDPTKPKKYAQRKWIRHAGFLLNSRETDASVDVSEFNYPKTLSGEFGQYSSDDVATFLFGKVLEGEESHASRGRLSFDDIILDSSTKLLMQPAWDILGSPAMGSPNPRANTAWYFTSKGNLVERLVNKGKMPVWEAIPDQIRGRKFYFHQFPGGCFEHYRDIWKKPDEKKHQKYTAPKEGWADLVKYEVESLASNQTVGTSRIYFADLPMPLVKLLKFSLTLQTPLAHKLGGLKPFGFGSVTLQVNSLEYRKQADVFAERIPDETEAAIRDIDERLIDSNAWLWLQKIMRFPDSNTMDHYKFIYPIFRPLPGKDWIERNNVKRSDYDLGFAQLERKFNERPPQPGKTKKITMFFDQYQKKSNNFEIVFGENFPYRHD